MLSNSSAPVAADALHVLARPAASRLRVHGQGQPSRREVEALVRRVYAARYQAAVHHFAPTLVSIVRDARVVAAAGYRRAADEALFLERYLQAPVESLLLARTGRVARREQIFEVGHLAAVRPGAGRKLVLQLCSHLVEQGCEWVVATLTSELRQLFVRAGVEPLLLGIADPRVLAGEASSWGSYYDHRPMVLAAHLPRALRQLSRSGAPRAA